MVTIILDLSLTKVFAFLVLNVSHNELVHMSPHITRLKQLKALILNHNKLLEIENIEPLLELNTLGKQNMYALFSLIFKSRLA